MTRSTDSKPQAKPLLDLAQPREDVVFQRKIERDRDALLAECKRQREQIKALREVLVKLVRDADQMCKDEGWPMLDMADEARAALAKVQP